MAILFKNNAASTLTYKMTDAQEVLYVVDASVFPVITPDSGDTPKPTPVTPKTTWQTNKELFDSYMDYLDKLQNRPLASIIVAQSNQQEPDVTDIEKLAKYEERKKYLREKRDVLLSNSTQDLIALIDSYTEADVLANQKLAKTVA